MLNNDGLKKYKKNGWFDKNKNNYEWIKKGFFMDG